MKWREALQTVVRTTPFEIGLYIRQLSTGETFTHNETRQFRSASLIKLFIFCASVGKIVYEIFLRRE